MGEAEANENLSIAKLFDLKGRKKKKTKKNKKRGNGVASSSSNGATSRISLFDSSPENFFRDMETVANLCGEEEQHATLEQSEIQRISSSVTFLREWKDFKYPSRSIRFAHGSTECYERNDVSDIKLPQFSSATVPKSCWSRDFVMNVGGLVWALDWCPRIHEEPDSPIKCEFLAVAAHPPGSSYHKMGGLLTGRGVVQIWCLVNIREEEKEVSSLTEKKKGTPKKDKDINDKSTEVKRPRGRPRKNLTLTTVDGTNCETQCMPPKKDRDTNDKSTEVKRPRGRPRKNPTVTTVDDTNCETQCSPPLAVQFAENSIEFPVPNGNIENNKEVIPVTKRKKRGPKKNEVLHNKSILIKRPRGRPRKNPKEVTTRDPSCENQLVPLAIQLPEDSAEFISPDVAHGECDERPRKKSKNSKEVAASDPNFENQSVPLAVQFPEDSAEFVSPEAAHNKCDENASHQYSNTKVKRDKRAASACKSETHVTKSRLKVTDRERRYDQDTSQPLLIQCESEKNHQPDGTSELEPPATTCSIPEEITLPRVVSCLAHNGKVAWDVKWQPLNISDSSCKHRMGYLAVLLGNGSLEVWEVPLPHVIREIYTHKEGTDPRFIKLEPVFKCSTLKCGSSPRQPVFKCSALKVEVWQLTRVSSIHWLCRWLSILGCGLIYSVVLSHSIPLTVEWSVTPPHDYLLAGCHDGTVALWKFSTNSSSKCEDTKPVLCFHGDTVPIRTIAWAPFEGDPESYNIIVTAGDGLKFWDLRNPFRPLRVLHPTPRIIYSLDWLSKPSCIIMSCEDGTIKTISLVKAASDLPVTGKIYTGKKQPWLRSSLYSSYAIWNVQVSRATGMVAYCGADGTAVRFQLTTKAVETDNSYRFPYFLCGSVSEEESTIIVNSPVSNTPVPLRRPHEKGRYAESFRDLLSKTNLSKIANNQMAEASNNDSQTLALYDGDNLELESGSEEALSSEEQPKRRKQICSSKKKQLEGTTSTNAPEVDNEKSDIGNTAEVLPPKKAALHRVRWNMNKGSERWLCFGGASGLVRCQKIIFSDIDKKWALKR